MMEKNKLKSLQQLVDAFSVDGLTQFFYHGLYYSIEPDQQSDGWAIWANVEFDDPKTLVIDDRVKSLDDIWNYRFDGDVLAQIWKDIQIEYIEA